MRTFRHLVLVAALVAAARPAAAQHDAHAGHAPAAHAMRTPCPLHLDSLALTPVQDTALVAIRAAHMAEMKAVKARLGMPTDSAHHPAHHEAMQASMARSLDAVRAILDDTQRVRFEAAVAAHAAEKKARRASGQPHDCGECCKGHDAAHGAGHGAMHSAGPHAGHGAKH